LALTALSLNARHPPSASVLSLSPFRLVSSRSRSSEERNKPETAGRKNMKLEEVNTRTKEAVDPFPCLRGFQEVPFGLSHLARESAPPQAAAMSSQIFD
jgi:hypothetical protein